MNIHGMTLFIYFLYLWVCAGPLKPPTLTTWIIKLDWLTPKDDFYEPLLLSKMAQLSWQSVFLVFSLQFLHFILPWFKVLILKRLLMTCLKKWLSKQKNCPSFFTKITMKNPLKACPCPLIQILSRCYHDKSVVHVLKFMNVSNS